mgnify:CR=1 FL=1|jgi:transposase
MSEKQQPSEKRRRWTAKAKLEVVLEGLRGQESVAEICRRHGITQSMYYEWQEAVFKAAEEGLTHGGRTAREAELEKQLRQAQRTIGRLTMENELYQKNKTGSPVGRRSRSLLSPGGETIPDRSGLSCDGHLTQRLLQGPE